jgi:NADPH:quinone reductase-like Zn-dependent oxidoreductase
MKAIIQTRSGPPEVLQLTELPKPTPGANEVLIKTHAATVTRGDVVLRKMPGLVLLLMRLLMGMKRKKIPGSELAGEVEAVGKDVTRFQPGEAVFGTTGMSSVGSYAEYVSMLEDASISRMPDRLSFEQAAALPVGGFTALYFLRQAEIQSGQKVLINGASGSVGTYAVQIAKHFGAEVTGVCSTSNLEMVRSLGADAVIDYTQEDFTLGGERYAVIFDAVGKTTLKDCEPVLEADGVFVSVQKGLARETTEGLNQLAQWAEEGKIRPVIDRKYPLEQIVEAHRYVESGHKSGNVVISVA